MFSKEQLHLLRSPPLRLAGREMDCLDLCSRGLMFNVEAHLLRSPPLRLAGRGVNLRVGVSGKWCS